jgi:plastocyanin
MSVRCLLAISVLALAACGDDGGGTPADAPTMDAQSSSVMEVTCPATPAASFVTQAISFSPMSATINVGQTVKLESNSIEHPIAPFNGNPAETDPGIRVPANQTKCFVFTRAGTFKFICMTHNYLGTLTVN